jgi:hypothetical protein
MNLFLQVGTRSPPIARIPFLCGLRRGNIVKCAWPNNPLPSWPREVASAANCGQHAKGATRGQLGQQAHVCRAKRSEESHFIRRISDGVIAENQGKARSAGDLSVALFPSKHSRVRPPPGLSLQGRLAAGQGIQSPAPRAKNKAGLRLEANVASESSFPRSDAALWPFWCLHPIAQDENTLARQAVRETPVASGGLARGFQRGSNAGQSGRAAEGSPGFLSPAGPTKTAGIH